MKPILVNVDYDDVLAGGRPQASRLLALEFLAFWITDRVIRVHRPYADEYLRYVEAHTGRYPQLKHEGTGENWWGALKNKELEEKINSKAWSFEWWKPRWSLEGEVVTDSQRAGELVALGGPWMVKRAHGMSGRGNKLLRDLRDWDRLHESLYPWFEQGAVVEPYRDRVSDLSALWSPESQDFIFYRNDIDERFQWRGVTLEAGGDPRFSAEETSAMRNWKADLGDLADELQKLGHTGPFSVDAFFYRQGRELKFHPCSEINARKTMGWIARELWNKNRPAFASLFLVPQKLSAAAWLQKVQAPRSEAMLLSPADAPFAWYWSEASDETQLLELRDRA